MFRSSRLSVCLEISRRNASNSPRARAINRQRTTPWTAGMGPSSTACRNTWRWLSSRMLGGARRLAVQQTIRALGVETDNPAAHDLHSDAADPRRVARAAAVNLGQRQETPGLTGIVPDAAEPNHRNHPRNKIPAVMANLHVFAILNQTAADSGIPPNESPIQGLGITHRARSASSGWPRRPSRSSRNGA
jgi:hypothetical protein